MKQFNWPLRVYYEDTDASGVVYYANYLKFMERARSEWLRHLGFEQDALREQVGIVFMVRAVALDYYRPARFNDALNICSQVSSTRRVSVTFGQDIYNKDTLLCTAQVRVACVNAVTLRPQAIPASMLLRLSEEVIHAG